MKSGVKNNSEEYSSTLVKENSEGIKSALNDVITITKSLNDSGTKKGKEHLNFTKKLISKIKKELILSKNKEKRR